ncbi:hypothetical protein Bpfe_006797, partial [Biomphalaria pfeifferi]
LDTRRWSRNKVTRSREERMSDTGTWDVVFFSGISDLFTMEHQMFPAVVSCII